MLDNLLLGLMAALQWKQFLFMILGTVIGLWVGVLPGLGGPVDDGDHDPVHVHDGSAVGLADAGLGFGRRGLRRIGHLDPAQHSGRGVVGRHRL